MQNVLVAGKGKIGNLVATLLGEDPNRKVHIADIAKPGEKSAGNLSFVQLDVSDENKLEGYIKDNQITAIISCLPYFCNASVARVAKACQIHYFDLSEDVHVSQEIQALAKGAKSAFVPHCGLAPGFISIVANHLMSGFSEITEVFMRVGALPVNSNNALNYSLTWSVDGLINEYGNVCHGIKNGQPATLQPLEGLEKINIDGLYYEAFNTSGGLGTLANTYAGKVNKMNYKTLRYPGHCRKMRFLMNGLKLNEDRDVLKQILLKALPKTSQDVVLIYVDVTGMKNGEFVEQNYVKKVYPKEIAGSTWSAIQLTTASSVCAVFDLVTSAPEKYQGLVLQESIPFEAFMDTRFGQVYA